MVQFQCSDSESGVLSCPATVAISTEGANQTTTVQATDNASNVSYLGVGVSLDMTPPALAFASAVPTSTSSASVTVEASVSDALAGIAAVTCNGVAATIVAGVAQCAVPLRAGDNLVAVEAIDLAGNAASVASRILRTGTAAHVRAYPDHVLMVVGDHRPIELRDQDGQLVTSGISWASEDDTVADADTSSTNTLVAHATGQTTLTATVGSASSDIQVTVLAGPAVGNGNTVWSIAPEPDYYLLAADVGPSEGEGPVVFSVEQSYSDSAIVRAVRADGAQKWATSVSLGAYEWTQRLVASPTGGALLVSDRALIRVGAPSGGSWRHDFDGYLEGLWTGGPQIAQRSDGTVIAVVRSWDWSDIEVFALSDATGTRMWSRTLPQSRSVRLNQDCFAGDNHASFDAAETSAPVVDENNMTALFVTTYDNVYDYMTAACDDTYSRKSGALTLLTIGATGSSATTTLWDYDVSDSGPAGTLDLEYTAAEGLSLAPQTGGGVVAIRGETTFDALGETPEAPVLSTHYTGSDVTVALPAVTPGDVMIGEAGTAVLPVWDPATYGSSTLIVDTLAGSIADERTDFIALSAAAEGGLVGINTLTLANESQDAQGSTLETGAESSGAQPVYGSLWTRVTTLGLEGLKDVMLAPPNSPYPYGLIRRAATRATVENQSASTVVVKRESCQAGFATVLPVTSGNASKFYAPFDGVQPPVSGWSTGDWFKVQDGIRVKVEAGGVPPTPSGLGLVLACWSDNPTDTDYVKCGGHKAEPHWSAPLDAGGAGAVDWKYPRPSTLSCGSEPWYRRLFPYVVWAL